MPELPEVQTTVDGINAVAKGRTIRDAWTDYGSAFHANKEDIKNPAYFRRFRKAVSGAKILSASRRGKNVLIHLENGKTVLIHMKMTGHMMHGLYRKLPRPDAQKESWRPATKDEHLNDPFNRFIHLVFTLSNGKHLVLSDMRKFAKVTLVDTDKLDSSEHIQAHGPEPLEKSFGPKELLMAVSKRPNGHVKSVLMDHTIVAGIGNIYSDEVLWRVGIHPLQKVGSIPIERWPDILKAIKDTLRKGIDFGGDSMSDYRNIEGKRGKFQERHNAYRKTGSKCSLPGCAGTIARIKVGGRSAHFCDVHQKLRK